MIILGVMVAGTFIGFVAGVLLAELLLALWGAFKYAMAITAG